MTLRICHGHPLVLLACVLTAQAAPAIPEADGPLSAPQPPAQPAPALVADPAQDGSKSTIDLLIEMQPREPGLQFGDRARPSGHLSARTPSSTRPGTPAATQVPTPATAAPESPIEATAGLFGAGATPAVHTRATGATPAAPDAPRLRTDQPATPPAALREPPPAWLDWPRQALLYVRDNRNLVLGSAAAGLLLIWGLSAILPRIGRRTDEPAQGTDTPGVNGPHGSQGMSSERLRPRHRSRRRHR